MEWYMKCGTSLVLYTWY